MAATIRDVAAAAGVSTATVSRALHADERVALRTRLRVEEAARRLAYRPSATAARLASGRHGVVAFVATSALGPGADETLQGLCAELESLGVDCSLHLTDSRPALLASVVDRLSGRADAAVVLSGRCRTNLDTTRLPVVVVGSAVAGAMCVETDLHAAAMLSVGHLAGRGYERLLVLCEGDDDPLEPAVRSAALDDARSVRVVRHSAVVGGGPEAAARATTTALAAGEVIDAILCTSDRLVRGAARALQRHGLLPGDDVGLLGVGSAVVADDLDVTMVVEPWRELGAAAARLAVQPGSPGPVRLAPDVHLRSSTVRRRSRAER